MRTVSLRFLPLTMIVSPRNKPRVSIVAGLIVATLLSSAVAYRTSACNINKLLKTDFIDNQTVWTVIR